MHPFSHAPFIVAFLTMTILEANELILKDESGKTRIVISAGTDDFPSIRLRGADGSTIEIAIDRTNPRMLFQRSDGRFALSLAMTQDNASVVLYDPQGKPAISARVVDGTGEPTIALYKEGQPFWSSPDGAK